VPTHSKALSRPTNYDEFDWSPPEIAGDIEELGDRSLGLMPTFSGQLFQQQVQYGVIVEIAYGRGLGGSQKRRYWAEFTEQERKLIAKWVSKFYRWHLVTGTPKRVQLRLTTLQLLQRAVAFYAGC